MSAPLRRDRYLAPGYPAWIAGGALAGLLAAFLLLAPRVRAWRRAGSARRAQK